jgi:hypothetical protein
MANLLSPIVSPCRKTYNSLGENVMRLDDYIEILLVRMKISHKQIDRQLLQWLLELRTLRGQAKLLESENRRLRQDYEKAIRQSERL